MRSHCLHTVCEEANCPNMGECWGQGTATFLILGDICTRNCRFCNVRTGHPRPLDPEEPRRVAEAARVLGLKHVVVTSVDRDDLADGGAGAFVAAIRQIRSLQPRCTVEVLIPDFRGQLEPLRSVVEARPDILGHNVDTPPALFPTIQPQCRYAWSLALLRSAKALRPEGITKSGLMVGLGESIEDTVAAMGDLAEARVDCLTLGQYLRPSKEHAPIARYYTPEDFEMLRRRGYEMGFRWVESGPLVRSSYHAREQAEALFGERPPTASPSP